MKVNFFEKKVIMDFGKVVSIYSTIVSMLFLFLPNLCQCIKYYLLVLNLIIIILIYIIVFVYYKVNKSIKLKINNTTVNIFFDDIFSMRGVKVIAFNEYFDTTVDDEIISKKSLNGQLVNKFGKSIIDKSINSDKDLKFIDINDSRLKGKKNKYELGTIHKFKDYFLLAFSHFNEKNEAELYSNDYARCLLEMWRNLNVKYSQKEIFIPLLGGGITRILDNKTVEEQELLEIMLNTLKMSKQTFKKPSTINIVLYNDKSNYKNFNFAKIKDMFK